MQQTLIVHMNHESQLYHSVKNKSRALVLFDVFACATSLHQLASYIFIQNTAY